MWSDAYFATLCPFLSTSFNTSIFSNCFREKYSLTLHISLLLPLRGLSVHVFQRLSHQQVARCVHSDPTTTLHNLYRKPPPPQICQARILMDRSRSKAEQDAWNWEFLSKLRESHQKMFRICGKPVRRVEVDINMTPCDIAFAVAQIVAEESAMSVKFHVLRKYSSLKLCWKKFYTYMLNRYGKSIGL